MVPSTSQPGRFTLWVFVHSPFDTEGVSSGQLHSIRLDVPRRFYVNVRVPKPQDSAAFYRKVSTSTSASDDAEAHAITTSNYCLPRSHPVYHLYEYNVPEEVYVAHMSDIAADLAQPEIEGVYELQVPSLFRLLARLGCLCAVNRRKRKEAEAGGGGGAGGGEESFQLDQLEFRSLAQHTYLGKKDCLRKMFLFHYQDFSNTQGASSSRKEASRQVRLTIDSLFTQFYVHHNGDPIAGSTWTTLLILVECFAVPTE